MDKAMRIAATGMRAQQMYVDTIANNLANVNTTAFKKNKIEFQDLLYQSFRSAGAATGEDTSVPTELQVGSGTKPVATSKMFSQGDAVATDNPLDLAIEGDGFLQVTKQDGTILYTRDGSLKISADGQLVTSDGYHIVPDISLPLDTESISFSRDGIVSVIVSGSNEAEQLGQIELAKFVNPAGLKSMGQNLFAKTSASGDPLLGNPDSEGYGAIAQGYLEGSNVQMVEEMVSMIMAQRAYEINSKTIKTSDDMLGITNNLKR